MDQNLTRYLERHQLSIVERLGFGIHGAVYAVENGDGLAATAVKVFRDVEFFEREFGVYQRLDDHRVKKILGFDVPELLRADEELLVLEMTIVQRPFVLDFAGAYLDFRPEFSREILEEWEAEKRDQFGERWKIVCEVLEALEEMGIHYIDVSPSNIAFRD